MKYCNTVEMSLTLKERELFSTDVYIDVSFLSENIIAAMEEAVSSTYSLHVGMSPTPIIEEVLYKHLNHFLTTPIISDSVNISKTDVYRLRAILMAETYKELVSRLTETTYTLKGWESDTSTVFTGDLIAGEIQRCVGMFICDLGTSLEKHIFK